MSDYDNIEDIGFPQARNSIDDATPEEWDAVNKQQRYHEYMLEQEREMNKQDKQKKYNASKSGAQREALGVPYMKQLPLEALAVGATALEYGAKKYADRNWEKGLPWQQMIDSLKRHIDDFERGRDYDDGPDGSGLPHICMIMAGAMMLSASVVRKIGEDDRMPAVAEEAYSAKDCAKWMQHQLERAEEFKSLKQEFTLADY